MDRLIIFYTGELSLWGEKNGFALVLVTFLLPYLLIAELSLRLFSSFKIEINKEECIFFPHNLGEKPGCVE